MTQGADEFMHCVAVLTVLRVSQASYLAKSGRQRVGLAANIKPCITEVRGSVTSSRGHLASKAQLRHCSSRQCPLEVPIYSWAHR